VHIYKLRSSITHSSIRNVIYLFLFKANTETAEKKKKKKKKEASVSSQHLFNEGGGEVFHGPISGGLADIHREVSQQVQAGGRVSDLRMKLNAVHVLGNILKSSDVATVGFSDRLKSFRQHGHLNIYIYIRPKHTRNSLI
jgi:hypothetical protein